MQQIEPGCSEKKRAVIPLIKLQGSELSGEHGRLLDIDSQIAVFDMLSDLAGILDQVGSESGPVEDAREDQEIITYITHPLSSSAGEWKAS